MRSPASVFSYLFLLLFFSCSKGEHGCLDKDAENYEPNAGLPCSCCQFYGRARLSWSFDFAYNLEKTGVSYFQIYVNGQFYKKTTKDLTSLSGSALPEKSFNEYNGIEATDENVINLALGAAKEQLIKVTIFDSNARQVWAGNVTLKANRVIFVPVP